MYKLFNAIGECTQHELGKILSMVDDIKDISPETKAELSKISQKIIKTIDINSYIELLQNVTDNKEMTPEKITLQGLCDEVYFVLSQTIDSKEREDIKLLDSFRSNKICSKDIKIDTYYVREAFRMITTGMISHDLPGYIDIDFNCKDSSCQLIFVTDIVIVDSELRVSRLFDPQYFEEDGAIGHSRLLTRLGLAIIKLMFEKQGAKVEFQREPDRSMLIIEVKRGCCF